MPRHSIDPNGRPVELPKAQLPEEFDFLRPILGEHHWTDLQERAFAGVPFYIPRELTSEVLTGKTKPAQQNFEGNSQILYVDGVSGVFLTAGMGGYLILDRWLTFPKAKEAAPYIMKVQKGNWSSEQLRKLFREIAKFNDKEGAK